MAVLGVAMFFLIAYEKLWFLGEYIIYVAIGSISLIMIGASIAILNFNE